MVTSPVESILPSWKVELFPTLGLVLGAVVLFWWPVVWMVPTAVMFCIWRLRILAWRLQR